MSIVTFAGGAPDVFPAIKLADEVITPEEEKRLIEIIESCDPVSYPGDAIGGLRSISFGWHYDFGNDTFAPCEPIPDDFALVREVAARFAGIEPEDFVQILLNRYGKGAEIPWHCDKPIWEDVVGLSLGSAAPMHFRMPREEGYSHNETLLAPRSMYLLSGDIRHRCDHSIPAVADTRWSITFRTFAAQQ